MSGLLNSWPFNMQSRVLLKTCSGSARTSHAVSYANRAHDSGVFQLAMIVTTTGMTIIIAIVGVSLGVARRDEPRMTNRMAYHHRRRTHRHWRVHHNDR